MALMKEGSLKMLRVWKDCGFCSESRQVYMKASYPKPKPLSIGPNSKMIKVFQQLLLERAMLPVRQIKKSIVSRGYKIDIM